MAIYKTAGIDWAKIKMPPTPKLIVTLNNVRIGEVDRAYMAPNDGMDEYYGYTRKGYHVTLEGLRFYEGFNRRLFDQQHRAVCEIRIDVDRELGNTYIANDAIHVIENAIVTQVTAHDETHCNVTLDCTFVKMLKKPTKNKEATTLLKG